MISEVMEILFDIQGWDCNLYSSHYGIYLANAYFRAIGIQIEPTLRWLLFSGEIFNFEFIINTL